MEIRSTLHEPLGTYLKDKRIQSGLTQSEVSTALGYTTPQFVSNFERGLCSPPLQALAILVSLYKINPEELIDIILDHEKIMLRETLSKEAKINIKKQRKSS